MAGQWTKNLIIVGVILIAFFVFVKMYVDTETAKAFFSVMEVHSHSKSGENDRVSPMVVNNLRFLEQRNNLSRILNLKQQKIGQMDCEVNIFIYSILRCIYLDTSPLVYKCIFKQKGVRYA